MVSQIAKKIGSQYKYKENTSPERLEMENKNKKQICKGYDEKVVCVGGLIKVWVGIGKILILISILPFIWNLRVNISTACALTNQAKL